MATKRKNLEDFISRMKKNGRNGTGPPCKFEDSEMESLVEMFKKLCGPRTKMDRTKFRDELQTQFKITDDFLMDRIFRAFDRDNDGYLKQEEWIWGLHVFLRGDLEDRINFCFLVFDLNGDGYISREEMFHLLKSCLIKVVSEDDTEEGVKDLVETVLKKLDMDHDGRVTLQDFRGAINADPLLLESLGTCLPAQCNCMDFVSLLRCNLAHSAGMHHKQPEMKTHHQKENKMRHRQEEKGTKGRSKQTKY